MNVLAWRAEYTKGDAGQVRYVDWFVATQYGLGQFRIRQEGTKRPTITCETQIKTPGWLKNDPRGGFNAVNQHMLLRRMIKRAAEANARTIPMHQPSIEAINEKWLLDKLFQGDDRAHNAWCNLTGVPVGQTFEEIAVKAEVIVAEQREVVRKAKVEEYQRTDDSFGMF